MKGVLVRYPLGIPPSLVALFSTDAHVHVLCEAVRPAPTPVCACKYEFNYTNLHESETHYFESPPNRHF